MKKYPLSPKEHYNQENISKNKNNIDNLNFNHNSNLKVNNNNDKSKYKNAGRISENKSILKLDDISKIQKNNFLSIEKKYKNEDIKIKRKENEISENLQKTKTQQKNENKNDYLNLIRCSYPYCNCGKCIQKKNRDYKTSPDYNYQRNMSSNYKNEFEWKEGIKTQLLKKGKISHLDQGYKEHIKNALESVAHKDYKNQDKNKKESNTINNLYTNTYSNINNTCTNPNSYDIKNKNDKEDINTKYHKNSNKDNLLNIDVPFFGRSSYATQFPHWNTFIDRKPNNINNKIIRDNVAFIGMSSYTENYPNFDDKHYREKINPVLKKDNLEIKNVKMICSTSTGQTYKPLDYNMAKCLNSKTTKSCNLPNIWSAPNYKDCFMSTYEKAFMGNDFN
jgi:hypothetical protein